MPKRSKLVKKARRYVQRRRLENHAEKRSDEENVSGTNSDASSDSCLDELPNICGNDVEAETEMVHEIDFRPSHTSSPIPFDKEISDAECPDDSLSLSSSSLSADELYRGAGIVVEDFNAELLRIGAVHRMSDSCLKDILGLFANVLPPGNRCPTLHNLMKSEMEDFITDVQRKQTANGMYYILDVAKQIESICDRLPVIFDLPPSGSGEFRDVFDGTYFQSMVKAEKGVKLLYCLLSCDGVVPAHKSKGQVIWPITLVVLNLEPHQRRKFENMILVMLFYGAKKPDFMEFMKEVVAVIEAVSLDYQANTIRIRIIALVADLPAKAACLNMTQFNSYHPCNLCEVKGNYLFESHKMTYSPDICKPRRISTHTEYTQLGSNKKPFCGVKGPTPLATILEVPKAAPFDIMHLIYLGVTKTLTIYAMGKKLFNQCNASELLCHQVTVPSGFKRRPRSLEVAAKWKANEWKAFLLYYGVPIMCCTSSKKLTLLFSLLSTAISVLSSNTVNAAAITAATELIQAFQRVLCDNFGYNSMTFSIHALSHLPNQVLHFGPLWTHSAFAFESFYGQLTSFVTGTKCEADIIVRRFLRFHAHRFHRRANSINEENCKTDQDGVTALKKHQLQDDDKSKLKFSAVTVKGIFFTRKTAKRKVTSRSFAIADLGEPTFVVITEIFYFPETGFHCLVEKYQSKSPVYKFLNSTDPVYKTLVKYSPLKLIFHATTAVIKCSSLTGHFVTIASPSTRPPCLFAVPVIQDYEHD